MAKEAIGGHREPMDEGSTTKSGIETPMCRENVGHKNDPKTHSYKGTFNEGGGGKGTSNSIEGPGVEGEWKHHKPRK